MVLGVVVVLRGGIVVVVVMVVVTLDVPVGEEERGSGGRRFLSGCYGSCHCPVTLDGAVPGGGSQLGGGGEEAGGRKGFK